MDQFCGGTKSPSHRGERERGERERERGERGAIVGKQVGMDGVRGERAREREHVGVGGSLLDMQGLCVLMAVLWSKRDSERFANH